MSEARRDKSLVSHGPQNSGGNIDGFGSDGKDTTHHSSIEKRGDEGDSRVLDSDNEGRGSNTATTEESFIVGGDQDGDEDDAEHVDKVDSEGDELGGVGHGEARAFSFTSHDSDKDLVADSPGSEESAVCESLELLVSKETILLEKDLRKSRSRTQAGQSMSRRDGRFPWVQRRRPEPEKE